MGEIALVYDLLVFWRLTIYGWDCLVCELLVAWRLVPSGSPARLPSKYWKFYNIISSDVYVTLIIRIGRGACQVTLADIALMSSWPRLWPIGGHYVFRLKTLGRRGGKLGHQNHNNTTLINQISLFDTALVMTSHDKYLNCQFNSIWLGVKISQGENISDIHLAYGQ